jgi:hypothetical protein
MMRRALVAGLVAVQLAAPAVAEEPALSLAGRIAALGGYAMGALAECGLSEEAGKRHAERLLLSLGFTSLDGTDLDRAKHQLVAGVPEGRAAIRAKRLTCAAADARLVPILDALAGPL